ncbi:MAG: PolC-type DNA polymerase III [Oscillospiraceae bacterium]|jgi:DNA polymerase-3 subunit alpha (Gram-positive type)|nr:PolC-type DNA polymerase III [Oscillospiraceae bacterium]
MPNTVPFTKMFPSVDIEYFRDAEVLGVTIDKARASMTVTLDCVAPTDAATALSDALCALYGLQNAEIAAEPAAHDVGTDAGFRADEDLRPYENAPETAEIPPATPKPTPKPATKSAKSADPVNIMGKISRDTVIPISDLDLSRDRVTIRGRVFAVQHREVRQGKAWVLNFDVTDESGSVRVSKYMEKPEAMSEKQRAYRGTDVNPKDVIDKLKVDGWVQISGKMTMNRFEQGDLTLEPTAIATLPAPPIRADDAETKRVELHLHTRMSAMDAIIDVKQAVQRAIAWGHPAIAITDHAVVHSFPDAYHEAHGKIKVLYGVEGYYTNDVDARPAVFGSFDAVPREIVVFDLETTGLSSFTDGVTEIGAVVLRNGEVAETFHTYSNPRVPIPANITELTGITDDTVRDAPDNAAAVRLLLDFAAGRVLAAHNASFDIGFVYEIAHNAGIAFEPTCIDTLTLARVLYPEMYNHKLATVAQELGIAEVEYHRADGDAATTAQILAIQLANLAERGANSSAEINAFAIDHTAARRERNKHIIVFARNEVGLRNLYKLVTKSHIEHFSRYPIMPKSLILQHREGLILGSACEAGEMFGAVERSSRFEQHRLAKFYDYLEIQPITNNFFMLRGEKPRAKSEEQLRNFNRRMLALGDELGIPVCATCDAHFLDPEDEVFRRILMNAKSFDDALYPLPIYFRTTDEMLAEFKYLGDDRAYEVVVTNTRKIADMIDELSPLPPAKKLFPPKIEGSAETLKSLVYDRLAELYGDTPPAIVTERVEAEMRDILECNYDVIYVTAQMLVRDSLEHGYLVGSRGSVGSSFAAYLAGITEVNALPPHYLCPACKHTDFDAGAGFGCGADMPDAVCPVCGTQYNKEGFDIPFETFLGFGGDKVPDIDLNFSGEYQANAHRYTVELFGADHVFRAGTISTVAERTAFGYVKKYLEAIGKTVSRAEENRLAQGCVGVKRTTGQHPGGLVVIPSDMEITDFCPAQRPADDTDSDTITTHFEYHSMEDNLLKLDELGHDDPTMIKMLEDMTGVDARAIPLDDPETMRIFKSPEPLGIAKDEIVGETGTIGIPEFGTGFTRQMLCDTLPDKFATLVRLSGYSHGTDVWLGNAKDIILNKVADISATIGCRDDITLYLIECGMVPKRAFKVSESVRKGRGLPDGTEQEMRDLGVPDWYIGSCKKIKYLFPKAHAVAYVMMAFRIAWFKVHRPLAFYSAYFYRRSQKGSFDADTMTRGDDAVCAKIRAIRLTDRDRDAKDDDLLTTLEACHEFYLRGFSFASVDIYGSDAVKFEISGDDTLRPPLISVAGLGETAARDIAERRVSRRFVSVEEFSSTCSKVSTAHIEQLRKLGALGDMPDESQISLF